MQGSYLFLFLTDQNQNITGLTCDSTGKVYSAGVGISTYSGTGSSTTYLGDLPPDLHCLGDLTFRHGKLYMAAMGNKLVEVNLQNPAASTVFMDFPPGTFPIHGLATFNYECDSVETYAIGKIDTLSRIYHIDFQTKTITQVCETDLTIIGAATDTECAPPPYTIELDADKNNDSGASGLDFFADTICLPPSRVTDEDVEIRSCGGGVDSIQIMLTGILDTGQEYLDISGGGNNIQVTGLGTPKITLINTGNADNVDFQNLLKNIRYWNNAAPDVSFGTREISMLSYEEIYRSDTARAFITLDNGVLKLEADITEPDCYGKADGSVTVSASGALSPYTFLWDDGEMSDSRSDLSAGIYQLTITDSQGCQKADSLEISQPDSLAAEIDYSGFPAICDSSAEVSVNASGGTEPYSYLWNTGANTADLENLSAGDYSLTLTDARNCEAEASLTIEAGDTVLVFQKETLCEGDIFEFQNEEYAADTSFCVIFPMDGGCDSTLCFELTFRDTARIHQTMEICRGETIEFGGNLISTDSTICITQPGANGCDSTFCLEVKVIEYQTPIFDSFCEGDIYVFGNQNISDEGIYFDTLSSLAGCDSVLVLTLEKLPAPEINFSTSGNLCDGGEVEISADSHAQYVWSTGSQNESISVNTPGNYSLTVTDANDCSTSESIDIQEVELEVSYSATNPNCFGEASGQIEIESVTGGFPPYIYVLDNQPAQTDGHFQNLKAGVYEINVEDSEGCRSGFVIELLESPEIILEVSEDATL
ncbi:MAG: hypothetical protein D6714_15125, partial [Bacteroidetes bacterium]